MARRTGFEVRPHTGGGWGLYRGGDLLDRYGRKADAVAAGRDHARASQPSQLRMKGQDGRMQEERTDPRSSDPR